MTSFTQLAPTALATRD